MPSLPDLLIRTFPSLLALEKPSQRDLHAFGTHAHNVKKNDAKVFDRKEGKRKTNLWSLGLSARLMATEMGILPFT